ncbi:MAG TPA: histidine kinase [Marmoricola sp.]|nr:histidine kinase [Marmoricola sp.]
MDRLRSLGWRDAWLPGLIAVLAVAEMAGLQITLWGLGAVIEAGCCAVLVLRRLYPIAAPTLAMLAGLSMPMLGIPLDRPSVPIAIWALSFFSLARYVPDLRGMFGFVLVLGVVFVDYHSFDTRHHDWSDVVFVLVLAAPPYVLGRVMRRMADQKEALEQAQEIVREQAIRDERDRIARDLHDVIAHSVSAMVVQTAAAQDVVRSDPATAEAILADVADTGRRALAETGRLLHVIRDTADELGLEPAPGLAQVPDLVDRFRADGLQVDLRIDEPLPVLDAGVDVSAYRIVQEALTNALRYASDRNVSLAVASASGTLSIRSANRVNGTRSMGSGLGLLGMAERVAVLGGTLTHGVREPGRFELEAMLPVGR